MTRNLVERDSGGPQFSETEWRRLTNWLQEHGLHEEVHVTGTLAGGTQNELLRISVGGNPVVLRRHRQPGNDRADASTAREGLLLQALDGSEVPHPKVMGVCRRPVVLDTAFFVMAEVDGIAMEEPDPTVSRQVLAKRVLAAVDALTTLQTADPARTVPGRTWDDSALARQPSRWRALLESHEEVAGYDGLRSDDADPLVTWLERSVPATWPTCLVHGDFHLGNVMFSATGSDVRALVDWELATVGDPRLDLAWLLVTSPLDGHADRGALGPGVWDGFPSRDAIASRYSEAARDPEHLEWFEVLAALKLASILEGTRARAAQGRADAETAERLHQTAVRLHATAMNVVDC